MNKIEKVYALEYADIPKVFFTPHHTGNCCTNVIRGNCCVSGHSCTNVRQVIVAQQWEPLGPIVERQWVPTMGYPVPLLKKMQQTDRHGLGFFAHTRA
jgi:hypothetical protein